MCGIVGYAGNQQALPILLAGCGGSSTGVRLGRGGGAGREVQVVRKAGKLEVLERRSGPTRRWTG